MKNLWRLFITISSSLGAFFFLISRGDSFAIIHNVSLKICLLILLLKFAVVFTNALKFREMMVINGLPLKTFEWNGLSYITTFYSYFFPARFGNIFRAVYLKKNYNFEYSRFISLLIGSSFIDISITCLLGILASLCSYRKASVDIWILLVFIGVLILMLTLYQITRYLLKKQFRIKVVKLDRFLFYCQESLQFFMGQPKSFIKFCLIVVMSLTVRGLALFSCFMVLGVSPNVFMLFIAICFVNFSSMISLTPGNLGITEGTLAGVFLLLGLPLNPGIQAIALSRVMSVIVQSVLGVIFSHVLFDRFIFSNEKFAQP